MLRGDNGIITKATETKYLSEISQFDEQTKLAAMAVRTSIEANKVSQGGYIATKADTFESLAGEVAKELGVTAINAQNNTGNSAEKVSTEGYTVAYYLPQVGSESQNGEGYIVIWYTSNGLRSTMDRQKVIQTYGYTDITDYDSVNQAVLVRVIKVENYRSELSGKGLTSTTDADDDITKEFGNITLKTKITDLELTSTVVEGGTTPTNPQEPEITGPAVTIGGQTVTLTKANVASYMGKVVTNYKTPNSTEVVTVDGTNYTVSTTYRLYYVDFDGKYGEEGTVYLKADCTNNSANVKQTGAKATSKIYDLNPAIKTNGPSEENQNMKKTIWLLDTAKWNGLVTSGADTDIADLVNYVVATPSVELMMDSYNTYYNLTGNQPVGMATIEAGGEKVKLYYRYVNGTYGYQVGPGPYNSNSSGQEMWDAYGDYGYHTNGDWSDKSTTGRSVANDATVGTMYYPLDNGSYYLASPSSETFDDYDTKVILKCFSVKQNRGGCIGYEGWNDRGDATCICPVVSLKPTVTLEFGS